MRRIKMVRSGALAGLLALGACGSSSPSKSDGAAGTTGERGAGARAAAVRMAARMGARATERAPEAVHEAGRSWERRHPLRCLGRGPRAFGLRISHPPAPVIPRSSTAGTSRSRVSSSRSTRSSSRRIRTTSRIKAAPAQRARRRGRWAVGHRPRTRRRELLARQGRPG